MHPWISMDYVRRNITGQGDMEMQEYCKQKQSLRGREGGGCNLPLPLPLPYATGSGISITVLRVYMFLDMRQDRLLIWMLLLPRHQVS